VAKSTLQNAAKIRYLMRAVDVPTRHGRMVVDVTKDALAYPLSVRAGSPAGAPPTAFLNL